MRIMKSASEILLENIDERCRELIKITHNALGGGDVRLTDIALATQKCLTWLSALDVLLPTIPKAEHAAIRQSLLGCRTLISDNNQTADQRGPLIDPTVDDMLYTLLRKLSGCEVKR